MLPRFIYPQAAQGGTLKSAEPYWDDPHYIAQEKLDGARYILHKDLDGSVRIYSRQISKKTGEPVDKTLQLAHIAKEFDMIADPGTILDGEVCAEGLSSSNLVTRVTGSKPERALAVQREHGFLIYNAFDLLAYTGLMLTSQPYLNRIGKFPAALDLMRSSLIHVLPTMAGPRKRELYDHVVAKGGEGVILKDLREPYHQGLRHKSWIKVKRQRTFDVVFMGIEYANETSVKKGSSEETQTRIAGQAGAIRYGQYFEVFKENGPLFDAGIQDKAEMVLMEIGTVSGFDDATRLDITTNFNQYTGSRRVFEVTGQEQFQTGAIRHPRFVQWRDDKTADQCVFRADES